MPTSAKTMSGGVRSMAAIAASPSLTATTWTSSSAKVSSITRWMVTLSSARSKVCGTSGSGGGARVGVDEIDDVLHRRPRQEDAFHADLLEPWDVHVRDDTAD